MALALRSKTGCLKCRRRRVKCDEARPICQRCHRAGLDCVWPGRVHVTSSHLQSITTLGNLYASLFLQNGLVDYSGKHPLNPIQVCPAKQISPGYPPLRSAQEHHSLIKLTLFLRVLSFDKLEDNLPFELSVALQELWVRDALLAAATFVGGAHEKCELWSKVDPYYTSASKAIRHYISVGDLDEVRMELLLVASQFLGMIEINNPHNEIFPLLHFEAVGRLLKTLKTIQTNKVLPEATKRFHRIAFESYIYHISIQALFWPQTERYVTLSEIHEEHEHDLSREPHKNIIVKLDLNIYMILFRLSRLAKTRSLNPTQQAQADELVTRVQQMEETAIKNDVLPRPPESNPRRPNFTQMTVLATSILAILAAKVHDRTLLATTPSLRPLVAKALSRLEQCQPFRAWTGDFTWIFTILLCAVSTSDEVERLSRKLQTFAQGFLGSDLRRMKKVLELVRARRVAMTRRAFTDPDKEEDIRSSDTLDLLVEARLALSW